MKDEILVGVLGVVLLLRIFIDWIELREDQKWMMEDEEDEQREDDSAGAAAEDKR